MKYEKEIINIINKNIHLSNLTGKIDIDTNLCDLGFDSISFIHHFLSHTQLPLAFSLLLVLKCS